MSERNGDKARSGRQKKRRTQRRMRSRELAATVPAKTETRPGTGAESKSGPEKTA